MALRSSDVAGERAATIVRIATARDAAALAHNAYVFPERRGGGVFARMYAEVVSRARGAGVSQVRVSVMSDNAGARVAYARLGFDDITESIACERVNSVTDPAVYTQLGMTEPPFRVLEANLAH
jgi:GNAT superfamily N-acetyltransferase